MTPVASLNFYLGTMPPNRTFLMLAAPSFSLNLSRKFVAFAREMKQSEVPDPDPGTEFCRIMVGRECIWQGTVADLLSAVRAHGRALCEARQVWCDDRLGRKFETQEIMEAVGLVGYLQYKDRKWRDRERAQQKLWDGLIKSAVRKAPA